MDYWSILGEVVLIRFGLWVTSRRTRNPLLLHERSPMKYLSALLTAGSASLGGSTFARNHGGQYIRSRVAPVQPRTSAQQAIRASLSSLSGQWKGLTQVQIAAWAALATGITLKDSLGNSYTPTGNQLFVGLNQTLTQIAGTAITNAPGAPPDFPDMLPISATATAGTPSLTVVTSLAAAPTGFTFLLRATPQGSAGRSFFGTSKYRVVGHFASSSYASINALSAYTTKFGALVAATKLSLRLSLVQTSTGFESMYAESTIVVGA